MEGVEGSQRPISQVWLPSSGVWAAVPQQASNHVTDKRQAVHKRAREPAGEREPSTADVREQQRQRRQAPPPDSPPESKRLHYTGFELQQDREASDVESGEETEHPTCPICLTDIIDLSNKAVVTACMHTFCYDCITRWLSHKRFCPLCKARVVSVLYDITPAGTHREREVPPSPKLATAGSGQGADGDGMPLLQRLQDFLGVAGLLDPYHSQQQGQQGQGRQARGAAGQRLRTEAGSGRAGYGAASAAGRRPGQARGAPESAQQGPRPYFWRLQQRLQAGAYRPGSAGGVAGGELGGAGPVSEEDYVLLWRRQIYDQDLWALPLGSDAARISLGSGSARERRLSEWVDRELRALLQTDDTTIVRGFVMGLLVAYGVEPIPGSAGGRAGAGMPTAAAAAAAASRRAVQMVAAARRAAGDGAGSGSTGAGGGGSGTALGSRPEEALRPFLHEHAEHFWHELRCFATAPYTIHTYDRMVSYLRRQADAEQGPGAAGTAGTAGASNAGGSAAGRRSRWDQRQRGSDGPGRGGHASTIQRQQVWGGRAVQPARVVLHASRSQQQALQQQQAEAYQPAPDADVPRRGGDRSGAAASRNPSPPPLQRGAAASVQQALQPAPALDQAPRQQDGDAAAADSSEGVTRPRRTLNRSSSLSREMRRQQSRSRSRSRSRRRRRRQDYRSRSREQRRSRCQQRSRSRSRSYSPRGHQSRSRDAGWRQRQRRERHEEERSDRDMRSRHSRHSRRFDSGGYVQGEDDGGDRWCME